MAPILTSNEDAVGHTALRIKYLPSFGNELSFGASLAKVSRGDCIVFFVCGRKVSYYIYYCLVI